MFKNEMHVNFSSISQNEALARMIAAAFASQLNPTIEELTDVRTAVSEAVTNAIIHGYMDRQGIVYMDCTIEGGKLIISIRDEGCGISDVELAMQPFYTSMPNMERSGMGFAVMEAFMDDVKVESEVGRGTTVTLKKYISAVSDDE
ncbi:MAG: anti-sigma F factor [Clostridia bacterium]